MAGGAPSEGDPGKVRDAGALALEVDVTDQESVLGALRAGGLGTRPRRPRSNAASPYGGSRSGPFGGGPLADAGRSGYEDWSAGPVRGAFGFLSALARFLLEQGGDAMVVQVTGGSARRGMPGRGLWAAGALASGARPGRRGQLRERRIHEALLIVDATIDRSGSDDAGTADPGSLAEAVVFLASRARGR